ncbi:hypothetical protein PMZ80_005213 [Knufia obscura]|uniref:Uncharacterized protein n=1 Tax=Knufia obscura TaxID=1635080 RepID=A0ABR0RQY0_9EURO|nr:hypothetical protein PMZ80_005213 [Knufia obscura]
MDQQSFSRADVATLGSANEVCFVVHNKVYNVQAYLDDHPGGGKILREVAGADATAAFEDVGHSDDAREVLEKFCIGKVIEGEEVLIKARSNFVSKPLVTAMSNGNGWKSVWIVISISQSSATIMLMIASALLAARLMWPGQVSSSSLSMAISSLSGFWKGIILSMSGSAALFSSIVYQFSKTIVMTKGFRVYPPVMRVSKALVGPTKQVAATINPKKTTAASTFVPIQMVNRTRIAANSYTFTFRTVDPDHTLFVPAGQHVQLRIKNGPESIVRSYTPISNVVDGGKTNTLELAIKSYESGVMSSSLLSLPTDGVLECRGPLGSYKNYHRFLCERLGVIAGGSGITPIYALIKSIVIDENDSTAITLLYAESDQDSTMLRTELNDLARRFPKKLSVHYFWSTGAAKDKDVDHQAKETAEVDDQGCQGKGSINVHQGRLAAENLQQLLPPVEAASKYLVCGSDGFATDMVRGLTTMGTSQPKGIPHPTDQVFVF